MRHFIKELTAANIFCKGMSLKNPNLCPNGLRQKVSVVYDSEYSGTRTPSEYVV
jgi:hypothetical protein